MRLAFHIPEGIYTVEAQDGESAIYLIDDENGIYIWQQIGNDPENPNQAAVMDDLRFIRWSSFGSEKRGQHFNSVRIVRRQKGFMERQIHCRIQCE